MNMNTKNVVIGAVLLVVGIVIGSLWGANAAPSSATYRVPGAVPPAYANVAEAIAHRIDVKGPAAYNSISQVFLSIDTDMAVGVLAELVRLDELKAAKVMGAIYGEDIVRATELFAGLVHYDDLRAAQLVKAIYGEDIVAKVMIIDLIAKAMPFLQAQELSGLMEKLVSVMELKQLQELVGKVQIALGGDSQLLQQFNAGLPSSFRDSSY